MPSGAVGVERKRIVSDGPEESGGESGGESVKRVVKRVHSPSQHYIIKFACLFYTFRLRTSCRG